jgi:hypothetical protein
MRPGKRFELSAIEKSEIWRRWKAGQSLHEIGRAFDKPHSSIRCLLLPRGGIPPAARRRSGLALTLAEREDISRGIACGSPLREIARHFDQHSKARMTFYQSESLRRTICGDASKIVNVAAEHLNLPRNLHSLKASTTVNT